MGPSISFHYLITINSCCARMIFYRGKRYDFNHCACASFSLKDLLAWVTLTTHTQNLTEIYGKNGSQKNLVFISLCTYVGSI